MPLSPPEPLAAGHLLDDFASGEASLDEWLKRRARANHAAGASRVFVVAEERRAIGYYALASGAIAGAGSVGRFRRNMPEPIPVVLLGRLAIDRARSFYLALGFDPSPTEPMTLMVTLADLRHLLAPGTL